MSIRLLVLKAIVLTVAFIPVHSFASSDAVKVKGNLVLQKDSNGAATGIVFTNGDMLTTAPKDGKSMLSGSGSPITNKVIGNPGDFYIDTTSKMLYGPYVGSWPTGVSLVGPAGSQGPANQVPWVIVSGTSQVAEGNTGYITLNSALTTITLPANPSIGSTIRVAGPGSGGWTLAMNAGQYITSPGSPLSPSEMGVYWVARESQRDWTTVASSSDGAKLVAAANYSQIFTSSDSGSTWTAREIVPGEGSVGRSWQAVASSNDGTKLVAAVNGGLLYTSADSGATWIKREIVADEGSVSRSWISLTTSGDGTIILAAVQSGGLYSSSDSGATWQARQIVADEGVVSRYWIAVTASNDGLKLVAATNGSSGGTIYTSTDGGLTWTTRSSAGLKNWKSVASSSDGVKLVAVANGELIYTSSDSGASWIARSSAGTRTWSSVASSSDGTRLISAPGNMVSASRGSGGSLSGSTNFGDGRTGVNRIFTSQDGGVTWTEQSFAGSRIWNSVASSSDGTKLVAVAAGSDQVLVAGVSTSPLRSSGGQIYTSTQTPVTSGPTIIGNQTSAVELLYVGGGQYMLLSAQGTGQWSPP